MTQPSYEVDADEIEDRKNWTNPRYLSGRKTLQKELQREPHLFEISLWVEARWAEFRKLSGFPGRDRYWLHYGNEGHKLFDDWLQSKYPA